MFLYDLESVKPSGRVGGDLEGGCFFVLVFVNFVIRQRVVEIVV